MSYHISGDKLNNLLLKELLRRLSVFFDSIGMNYYVVGATARDIIMTGLYNQEVIRATTDLDITVSISDWTQFDEISEGICLLDDFEKDKNRKHRFIYKNVYTLDIVPFGGVANNDGMIYWQPDEDVAMSVQGYAEAVKNILEVVIDDEFTVKVVQLHCIFIQKLNAFADRHLMNSKDANDIAFIIENYLEVNELRVVEEYYEELYDTEDFDTFIAGSILLGKDVKRLFSDNRITMDFFAEIIRKELAAAESSPLISQILDTHRLLKYGQVFNALQNILREMTA